MAPPTFALDTRGDTLVVNRDVDPALFIQPERLTLAVQINTNDSLTFSLDSLNARTQTIDIFVPAPAYNVDVVGYKTIDTTAWFKGYFPLYISSDSALNRLTNTGIPTIKVIPATSVIPGCPISLSG